MIRSSFLLLFSWLSFQIACGKFLKDFPSCGTLTSCPPSSSVNDPFGPDLLDLECALSDKFSELNAECKKVVIEEGRKRLSDKTARRSLSSCLDDLKTLNCKPGTKLITCILDRKEELRDDLCRRVVQRLEDMIRAHFSLISNFTQICVSDVERLCNNYRLSKSEVSEDDRILDCLQKKIDSIDNSACQYEILRISEIQGEDTDLDDNLAKSCVNDVRKFCSHVSIKDRSKSLITFRCLQENVNDPDFSRSCRIEIFKKEQLVFRDSKVSKGLMRGCREDIRNNHCRRLVSDDKGVRLAQMLLCLENAVYNGTKVSPACSVEIIRHRKFLLADYRMSPEVVSQCSSDVSEFCNGLEKNGKTIHCLLENSRPTKHQQRIVSDICQRALEVLLKAADTSQDWSIDPVLRDACESVVRNLCDEARARKTNVMSCLMDNINSVSMDESCANAVLQIQYFISRNFKLDSQLFRACRDEAVRFCHAKPSWNDDQNSMDPERGPLILPCLYRHVFNNNVDKNTERIELKSACEKQVRRVMRQRATRAELIPEVEDSCIDDLARYCSKQIGPGEEMLCLQDKYAFLKSKCKSVVGNFTEAEASDVNLNPIVKKHCGPVIKELCQDELRHIQNESSDVISCLIKHKSDEDMKIHYKCWASVEHFQLISLNDYHFTVAFKNACRPYVIRYCPKTHTKAQVVECLSELTQNDTLKEERYKLSKECRYQLRAQLLQQREFIDLDPKLKSTCEKDLQSLCHNIKRNSEALECLEENVSTLSPACHKLVFRIQQHDFKDSSTDYTLLTTCKEMIKYYCQGDVSQAFLCLKKFKDEPVFDNNCRAIVLKRTVEQSADYRLNPVLQRSCIQDIGKFCLPILKNHASGTEFEGKILNCLKIKFRERKLRKECEVQLALILKESALNYKLNPLLRNLCTEEMNSLCGNELILEKQNSSGKVEECLKVAFLDGRIINRACRLEVAGLIEEAKADIHVDPLLFRACAGDVTKYCVDIPPGAGRILQCLQNILHFEKDLLQSNCKLKLSQRIEMFQNAEMLMNQDVKNLGELVHHIRKSPFQKYFIVSLFSIVGMVFILGLYCGRVSRKYNAVKKK